MKTINFISVIVAGVAMICSCQKADNNNSGKSPTGPEVPAKDYSKITCVSPSVSTKTSIGPAVDGVSPVLWGNGDQVKVYGATSQAGAVYTTSVSESVASATFTADGTLVTDDVRYAFYPAAAFGEMTGGKVEMNLSGLREQEYSTVFSRLPMFSKAENGSDSFSFCNLFGAVRVRVSDLQESGVDIASFILSAEEPVTGTMSVSTDGSIAISGDDAAAQSIEVTVMEEGNSFYFFLPAGTYEGFNFDVKDSQGEPVLNKQTSSDVVVEAGKIKTFELTFTVNGTGATWEESDEILEW